MMKISKALSLVVTTYTVLGEKRYGGSDVIDTVLQEFFLAHRHLTGSTREKGVYHPPYGGSDVRVNVRWLRTPKLGYFAPEITFSPSASGAKVSRMVAKAFAKARPDSPEELTTALNAALVEFIDDGRDDCWHDYRPVDPAPLVALAAQAE